MDDREKAKELNDKLLIINKQLKTLTNTINNLEEDLEKNLNINNKA